MSLPIPSHACSQSKMEQWSDRYQWLQMPGPWYQQWHGST